MAVQFILFNFTNYSPSIAMELKVKKEITLNDKSRDPSSLRKHPFLLAPRRWGRFAQNVTSGEERGETDVFAG